jgi:hypothetical protein
MSRPFNACTQHVKNRGTPPLGFLNTLVDWGVKAPNFIFERNDRVDIYSVIRNELGPWQNDLERRAAMLEALRVLAGFESSWNWEADVDVTNPTSNTPCTREAGILQCSGNSMGFDPSLKAFLMDTAGAADCVTFRDVTKTNHKFALEYCARLLRFTINHHGPVKRDEIQPWLRRDSMQELLGFLQNEMQVS